MGKPVFVKWIFPSLKKTSLLFKASEKLSQPFLPVEVTSVEPETYALFYDASDTFEGDSVPQTAMYDMPTLELAIAEVERLCSIETQQWESDCNGADFLVLQSFSVEMLLPVDADMVMHSQVVPDEMHMALRPDLAYAVGAFAVGVVSRAMTDTGIVHSGALQVVTRYLQHECHRGSSPSVVIMKFLEYTPRNRINGFLSTVNLGDSLLKGNLEAYSCKAAGIDKKYSRNLEQEVIESLAFSPSDLSASPLGPLSCLASRRTFIHLVLAMSYVYPDYDFSSVRPTSFAKEDSFGMVQLTIDTHLLEASKVWAFEFGDDVPFHSFMWEAIDEVIFSFELYGCLFNYKPEFEGDFITDRSKIWSFSYFFYNRKLKRILIFSCQSLSKLAIDEDSLDEMLTQEEGDYFHDMDME
ncbi:hypothetical protein L7F22_025935 [Adiantum nelumboides]|nr:hypothetical protein [Adiantum nelumboides]